MHAHCFPAEGSAPGLPQWVVKPNVTKGKMSGQQPLPHSSGMNTRVLSACPFGKRELALTAPSSKEKSRFSQLFFGYVGKRPPAVIGLIPSCMHIYAEEPSERARVSGDVRSYRRGLLPAAPSARGLDCKCWKAPDERWFWL